MAVIDYGLTTKERVKSRLAITVTDFDNLFDGLIYGVTDMIERFCGGRRFKRATYTQEVYDGSNIGEEGGTRRRYLVLKNAPLVTLTTIEYLTGSRSSPTWVAFTADDYVAMNNEGVIYFASGMPKGVQNIRVTYTAGYLTDFSSQTNFMTLASHNLPYELTDLAERLVTKVFKKRDAEGRSQETLRESSITYEALLSEADKAILANFKRVFLG